MIIPPILVLDESQSLLEMLRALAKQEQAFAKYAGAEAERISAMVRYLEEFGVEGVPPGELVTFCRKASENLRSTEFVHACLQSELDIISDRLGIGPLSWLASLPQGLSCQVRAGGQGPVRQENDPFYQGLARLEEVNICASRHVSGHVKYRVDKNALSHRLESVEEGLKIGFIDPRSSCISPENPLVALISGHGVLTMVSNQEAERRLARFALTVWDCGSPTGNRFRMMYVAPSNEPVCHDSGIVRS